MNGGWNGGRGLGAGGRGKGARFARSFLGNKANWRGSGCWLNGLRGGLLLTASDELADSGDERVDAGGELLVRGSGFLGELVDAGAKFLIRVAGLDGEAINLAGEVGGRFRGAVDLAPGSAPEGFVFLAILVSLFGKAGGEVLDALEAFFDGQGRLPLS